MARDSSFGGPETQTESVSERDQWSTKVEYLLATAGTIVGLGNVWRFPYLCFRNGGGAFLVPYLFFAVTFGVPLFHQSTLIGQYTQKTAATCWRALCPIAEGIGYSWTVTALYDCLCYNIILAWALFYLISSFGSPLPWTSCSNIWNTVNCVELTSDNVTASHKKTLQNNLTSAVTEFWERRVLAVSGGIDELGGVRWEILLCLIAAWIVCYFCIWKGVKSTGKAVYFTATFPYVMLLVLFVRGMTLPGALQGVKYYLHPDPSRLMDPQVWTEAATQIIFSYSLSVGSLTALGSYNPYKNNCYRDSFWLCLLNSCTSFLAGFAVFSVLGFMAQEMGVSVEEVAESGPGLAFIAYPQAAARMPFPQLWAVCFFIMIILLGLDTQFVSIEVIISAFSDLFPRVLRRPNRREIFLLIFCFACFSFNSLMTTQGGVYIFQLFDHYAANGICLLLQGGLECLVIGWIFGADRMYDVTEDMCGVRPNRYLWICWRFITPAVSLGAFIFYLSQYEALDYNQTYIYPDWAHAIGWLLTAANPTLILVCGLVKLCTHTGSLKQRLTDLCQPDVKLPQIQRWRQEQQ